MGLRDASDNLRIWDADGSLVYDFTPGAGQAGPRVGTWVAELGTGMKDGEVAYLRLGARSLNSVRVIWDATLTKWVTGGPNSCSSEQAATPRFAAIARLS